MLVQNPKPTAWTKSSESYPDSRGGGLCGRDQYGLLGGFCLVGCARLFQRMGYESWAIQKIWQIVNTG